MARLDAAGTQFASFSCDVRQHSEEAQMNTDVIAADTRPRRPGRQLDRHARSAAGLRRRPRRRPRAGRRHHPGRDRAQHRLGRPATGSTTRPPGCTARPATPSSTTTGHAAPTPPSRPRRLARTEMSTTCPTMRRASCRAACSRCSTNSPPAARDALVRVDVDGQTQREPPATRAVAVRDEVAGATRPPRPQRTARTVLRGRRRPPRRRRRLPTPSKGVRLQSSHTDRCN